MCFLGPKNVVPKTWKFTKKSDYFLDYFWFKIKRFKTRFFSRYQNTLKKFYAIRTKLK